MANNPDVDFLMEQALIYWRAQGMTMTAVRKIVCRKALSSTTAFDAEGLLQSVREEDGLISLSTVYRTLSALQDAGLITEIEGIDRKKQFSVIGANTSSTSHVVCKDCGKVIPLENPCLSLRESRTAHQTGFSPKKMSLRIEATCDELHQCGSCTRATQQP